MTGQLAIHGGTPVRTRPFPSWPVFGPEEEQALARALRSGKWGKQDGTEVATFERDFAKYQGAAHGIAVVNGTVSLQIALMAAGIRAGDEVIVPPYTFLATATAVITANATPVFVDIDPETLNISPKAIEAAITPRTRAIIPVHFGGLPADMDAIMAIAKRHNLIVIEDAAHAHGAEYKGRRTGSIGHFGSFSFQSSKNLTSGEGGFITTNDPELAARCRSIHNCGRRPGHAWYEHFVIAGNFRLSEFQGAVLNAQLQRLDEQTRRRDENGRYLTEKLGRIPGIKPQKITADCTRHAFHLFCFRVDAKELGAPRSAFLKALAAEGIPNFGGYPQPLYRQPLFLNREFGPYAGCQGVDYAKTSCPHCEAICYELGGWLEQRILLGTREDMEDIVRAFTKVYENRKDLKEA
ncbi:MAG TPA: DegT/DnrJ/EryC1/StrS family aminotransferase [Phycisphaerae bacterium]|nr:DegT/DnrJ/EryC1/StrS family aminotransferase [Phycisphaerae bacterium]